MSPKHRRPPAVVAGLACGLAFASLIRPQPAAAASPAPRLVVVLVVDQLRADLITRFEDLFVAGGFKRLIDHGAWFTHCHFEHAVTMTGPGHACVATGANPSIHGIVSNVWMEQRGDALVETRCSSDPGGGTPDSSPVVPLAGDSPTQLQAETLGDRLKTVRPGARVISLSLKDTAADMMAGRRADGGYWFDLERGRILPSDRAHDLPEWVQAFAASGALQRYAGSTWERIADPAEYARRCHRDDADYERGDAYNFGNTFPHRLPAEPRSDYGRALFASPFGNDLVLDLARAGVTALKLGRGPSTDALFISLSSNDVIGHAFGPHSHEVMDVTLRTDRQLDAFFRFLDAEVGAGNWLIALTGDHGVCPVPEYAVEQRLPAGRLHPALRERLEQRITQDCGPAGGARQYVAALWFPWLYFEPAALRSSRPDLLRRAVEAVIAEEPGIDSVVWIDPQLRPTPTRPTAAALQQRIALSTFPGRSGHAYLHFAANWFGAGRHATGHGTAHAYDTHVPLLLFGNGIHHGKYHTAASPTDIAPTLATLMGIPAPAQSGGRVLREALNAQKHP